MAGRKTFRQLAAYVIRVGLLVIVPLSLISQTSPQQQLPLRGFTLLHSEKERAIEKQFMAIPDAFKADANLKVLTEAPHIAGSPADRRNAEFVRDQFRSFGLDATIEEFSVVLSEPKHIKMDLIEPVHFSGPNPEFVAQDPASRDPRTTVGFNAYSASGNVTAKVVYANYGLPQDYDELQVQGISVEGTIVLVRYGKCYRGVKAMVAEQHKASAVIIYSDPQDDGYHAGDAYPKGGWRPATGVQRGSVLYDYIYPGVLEDHSNKPRIPVMPLSYADARHILENLSGPVASRDWQGGLPFTYHLGPGPAKVRLNIEMNEVKRPVWNVIAKTRGIETPEEIVVLGNHRDAWAYGAVDPNSGTAAMLEVARGLGALLRQGWRPRRSILLCSWDAEEPDEFGSTHWAEVNENEISVKAVAYLNVDVAVAGDRLDAYAVPSLKTFLKEVVGDVPDARGGSVLTQANQQLRKELHNEVSPNHVPETVDAGPIDRQEIVVGDLGGGTDYVAFLNHMGVPSTDFSFQGNYGVYHSIFDNYSWMKHFGDPEFKYHVAAARILGLEALRLSEADILPLDYETYGKEIKGCLEKIGKELGILGQASPLNLEETRKAAEELTGTGRDLNTRLQTLLKEDLSGTNLYNLNRQLVKAETKFLLPSGLPHRPWYRHSIYAPGFYNGYDATPLPGVHESIDSGNFEEANHQLQLLTDAITQVTNTIKTLARLTSTINPHSPRIRCPFPIALRWRRLLRSAAASSRSALVCTS
jgi:N-acetylated-alpha-linked acidic dipeptidase